MSSLVYNSDLRFREMAGFNEAWAAVALPRDGEPVSPELEPLLRQVYSDVLAAPVNLPALKESLTALLGYLAGRGRTNANCWAVDMFFCSSGGWERDWAKRASQMTFTTCCRFWAKLCTTLCGRRRSLRISAVFQNNFLLVCANCHTRNLVNEFRNFDNAARVEHRYGKRNLGPWDDFE
jgi:hypothetical protein